jgi:Uma2 family endonuclease
MKTATKMSQLLDSLGVSADRVLLDPLPGTATVRDLARLNDTKPNGRLYELVDGTLVEKAMGASESFIAYLIMKALGRYSDKHGDLGMVLGEAATLRLFKNVCRAPDVSFTYWDRLPNRKVPSEPVPHLAPDLAVEVISKGNRPGEMNRKLKDYFRAKVRVVWHVDPKTRSVKVFTSPTDSVELGPDDTLDGGDVLPGFKLAVASLFADLEA